MRTFTFEDTSVFVKTWCNEIDPKTAVQIHNLARLPFAFHHIAIMPDAHMGYGMPIGGVLATKEVVIPNAVGVDIGCGMRASRIYGIHEKAFTHDLRVKLREAIIARVPVGFHHHTVAQSDMFLPYTGKTDLKMKIVEQEVQSARYQVGTLGGGNHFIEVQADTNGQLWVMLHSGSRNVGKKVCDFYNNWAKEENKRWHSAVLPEWDLAFLHRESEIGQAYLQEMQWCVEFALLNRALMMDRIAEAVKEVLGADMDGDSEEIDLSHNYARLENHFGTEVMVHRKGACWAGTDSLGIIPGSQGSKSYIVNGLGNPDSFNSSSHGAGRAMGRNEAKKTLNLAEQKQILEAQGIVHGMETEAQLDEATGAYKDISEVMDAQNDLVDRIVELHPLVVVKDESREHRR